MANPSDSPDPVVITGASSGIGAACALHLDVTASDQIEAAAAAVEEAVGERGLSALVNNAGVALVGPLEFLDVARLRRQLEVNVVGQVAVTQAFLPSIWKKGFRTIDDVRAELPGRGRRLYDPFLSPMRRTFEGEVEDGISPETVAKSVAHAVRSPRPKTRYVVGRDARVSVLLRLLLPDRWLDALVRRRLGMPARPPG